MLFGEFVNKVISFVRIQEDDAPVQFTPAGKQTGVTPEPSPASDEEIPSNDSEVDSEEPKDAEPEPETPEPLEKEYLGAKGTDEYFYLLRKTNDSNQVEDLVVMDANDEEKMTASGKQMDVNNVSEFIIQAIKELEMTMVSYEVVMNYIVPKPEKQEEVPLDEPTEPTPNEETVPEANNDMTPQGDSEGQSNAKSTYTECVQLVEGMGDHLLEFLSGIEVGKDSYCSLAKTRVFRDEEDRFTLNGQQMGKDSAFETLVRLTNQNESLVRHSRVVLTEDSKVDFVSGYLYVEGQGAGEWAKANRMKYGFGMEEARDYSVTLFALPEGDSRQELLTALDNEGFTYDSVDESDIIHFGLKQEAISEITSEWKCQECGNHFNKNVPKSGELKCPKCGSIDIDVNDDVNEAIVNELRCPICGGREIGDVDLGSDANGPSRSKITCGHDECEKEYIIRKQHGNLDTNEKIRKVGDKWAVQSHKGKNLGTYSSKAEAEKRLKQVEYFKHKGKNESRVNEVTDGFYWIKPNKDSDHEEVNYVKNQDGKLIAGNANSKGEGFDPRFEITPDMIVRAYEAKLSGKYTCVKCGKAITRWDYEKNRKLCYPCDKLRSDARGSSEREAEMADKFFKDQEKNESKADENRLGFNEIKRLMKSMEVGSSKSINNHQIKRVSKDAWTYGGNEWELAELAGEVVNESMEDLDKIIKISKDEPSSETDPYMQGLANGLIVAKAVVNDEELQDGELVSLVKESLDNPIEVASNIEKASDGKYIVGWVTNVGGKKQTRIKAFVSKTEAEAFRHQMMTRVVKESINEVFEEGPVEKVRASVKDEELIPLVNSVMKAYPLDPIKATAELMNSIVKKFKLSVDELDALMPRIKTIIAVKQTEAPKKEIDVEGQGVVAHLDTDKNGKKFYTIYKNGKYVEMLLTQKEVEQTYGRRVEYQDGLSDEQKDKWEGRNESKVNEIKVGDYVTYSESDYEGRVIEVKKDSVKVEVSPDEVRVWRLSGVRLSGRSRNETKVKEHSDGTSSIKYVVSIPGLNDKAPRSEQETIADSEDEALRNIISKVARDVKFQHAKYDGVQITPNNIGMLVTKARAQMKSGKVQVKSVDIIEGRFVQGMWVSLRGPGGELGSEFAKTEEEAQAIAKKYAAMLTSGDTIVVEDGESEMTSEANSIEKNVDDQLAYDKTFREWVLANPEQADKEYGEGTHKRWSKGIPITDIDDTSEGKVSEAETKTYPSVTALLDDKAMIDKINTHVRSNLKVAIFQWVDKDGDKGRLVVYSAADRHAVNTDLQYELKDEEGYNTSEGLWHSPKDSMRQIIYGCLGQDEEESKAEVTVELKDEHKKEKKSRSGDSVYDSKEPKHEIYCPNCDKMTTNFSGQGDKLKCNDCDCNPYSGEYVEESKVREVKAELQVANSKPQRIFKSIVDAEAEATKKELESDDVLGLDQYAFHPGEDNKVYVDDTLYDILRDGHAEYGFGKELYKKLTDALKRAGYYLECEDSGIWVFAKL